MEPSLLYWTVQLVQLVSLVLTYVQELFSAVPKIQWKILKCNFVNSYLRGNIVKKTALVIFGTLGGFSVNFSGNLTVVISGNNWKSLLRSTDTIFFTVNFSETLKRVEYIQFSWIVMRQLIFNSINTIDFLNTSIVFLKKTFTFFGTKYFFGKRKMAGSASFLAS